MSASPPPHPRESPGMIRRLLGVVLPPFALFALVVAAWQAIAATGRLPPFLLPSPLAVADAAWQARESLAAATLRTGQGALLGFALSLTLGAAFALLFSQSRLIRAAMYPYAIFLQTVPVVAVAPLIILWFGYGFASILVVTVIISLFPIITNGTEGLTAIDRAHLELFEANNASRWQLLWKLRVPNSVPYFVTGARVSSGLSVIGAIVGELFVGMGTRGAGLGQMIYITQGQLKTALLFAAIIASTLLGLVIFVAVSVIGAALTRRWRSVA
jgi:NitT/TauT family transport system permease protein